MHELTLEAKTQIYWIVSSTVQGQYYGLKLSVGKAITRCTKLSESLNTRKYRRLQRRVEELLDILVYDTSYETKEEPATLLVFERKRKNHHYGKDEKRSGASGSRSSKAVEV